MTREIELTARDQRMLELLAGGISNKAIARKMGYAEGTMRVYLHDLYKKIGVDNKTAAVVWHFARTRVRTGAAGNGPSGPANHECFGDFALRTSLHAALGSTNMFLGPFGRLWAVAARLKGKPAESGSDARRRSARTLWEALLRANAQGVPAVAEAGPAESATELVLRSVLLLVARQGAAKAVIERLSERRKARALVTEGERTLVLALRDALEGKDQGLSVLYQQATAKSSSALERQVAAVALFHAYRIRGDADRARDTANALCAMAEDARAHLQAMGEHPLYRNSEVPEPEPSSSRALAAYLRKLGKASAVTA